MARTKQTARKSTGGRAPRQVMSAMTPKAFKSFLTSAQASVTVPGQKALSTSYINYENIFASYNLTSSDPSTSDTFATQASVLVEEAPLNGQPQGQLDAYVGINVRSKFDRQGMASLGRPSVDLVVALDNSGSMGSRFSQEDTVSKLLGAKQCLLAMLDVLQPDDTLGILVFNSSTLVLLKPTRWASVKKQSLRKAIQQLFCCGGTDLSGALLAATAMLDVAPEPSKGRDRTRRIVFMTDLQASYNSHADEQRVLEIVQTNSESAIYTSVVGVGVDLNQRVVQQISSICGCRYMSAVRTNELSSLMSTDFSYDVTMIARNVTLTLELPQGVGPLVQGYGSPEVNGLKQHNRYSVEISSEFPASSLKGGMYVFKLNRDVFQHMDATGTGVDCVLRVRHHDPNGVAHTTCTPLHIPNTLSCSSLELRKAVALLHYVDIHNEFLESVSDRDEPAAADTAQATIDSLVQFRQHFLAELAATGDGTLATTNQGDLQVLDKMIEVTALDASLAPPALPALPSPHGACVAATVVKQEPASMSARRQRKTVAHQARLLQQVCAPLAAGVGATAAAKAAPRRRSSRLMAAGTR